MFDTGIYGFQLLIVCFAKN